MQKQVTPEDQSVVLELDQKYRIHRATATPRCSAWGDTAMKDVPVDMPMWSGEGFSFQSGEDEARVCLVEASLPLPERKLWGGVGRPVLADNER